MRGGTEARHQKLPKTFPEPFLPKLRGTVRQLGAKPAAPREGVPPYVAARGGGASPPAPGRRGTTGAHSPPRGAEGPRPSPKPSPNVPQDAREIVQLAKARVARKEEESQRRETEQAGWRGEQDRREFHKDNRGADRDHQPHR